MRIFNLSNKSGSLTSSDKFVLDNGTNVMKIDYNALAKAIIEQYTGSTLAGSAQSVKAALDALNSKLFRYVTGVSYDTITTSGIYFCEAMSDRPATTYSAYGLIVIATSNGAVVKQIAYPMSGEAYWYMRHYSSSGWSAWKTITT